MVHPLDSISKAILSTYPTPEIVSEISSSVASALLIAQRITGRSSQYDPYILMGDFNAGEKTQLRFSR